MTDTGRRGRLRLRLPRFRWPRPPPGTITHISDDGQRDRYLLYRRNDVTTLMTEPVLLAGDHPWNLAGCLICHGTPAGDPVILVSIFDPRLPRANSWHVGCAGYFVHADHTGYTDADLAWLAHVTEYPGCSCHSISPVATAHCPMIPE